LDDGCVVRPRGFGDIDRADGSARRGARGRDRELAIRDL
jgi:hypothetical protein